MSQYRVSPPFAFSICQVACDEWLNAPPGCPIPPDEATSWYTIEQSEWYYIHPGQPQRCSRGLIESFGRSYEFTSTTSIAWDQPQQCFWIKKGDCTENNTGNNSSGPDSWTHLCFSLLPDAAAETYTISNWERHLQLDFDCPPEFEFLIPKNKFRNGRGHQATCRLVGELSLILALYAMYPQDAQSIPQYLINNFWGHGSNVFMGRASNYAARDKMEYPGRALVVKTAVVGSNRYEVQNNKKELDNWAAGAYGPMVSSRTPSS